MVGNPHPSAAACRDHVRFMFLLLEGRNGWAVLRTGNKYTKRNVRKGVKSSNEELAVALSPDT